MKIYSEQPLSEFHFWSGGAEHASYLTDAELDSIESQLTAELYPKGLSDVRARNLQRPHTPKMRKGGSYEARKARKVA